jgi:hypothetical protein
VSEQSASASIRLLTLGRIVVEAFEQSNRSAGMPDYGEAPVDSAAMHHAMSRGDHLEAVFHDCEEPGLLLTELA